MWERKRKKKQKGKQGQTVYDRNQNCHGSCTTILGKSTQSRKLITHNLYLVLRDIFHEMLHFLTHTIKNTYTLHIHTTHTRMRTHTHVRLDTTRSIEVTAWHSNDFAFFFISFSLSLFQHFFSFSLLSILLFSFFIYIFLLFLND